MKKALFICILLYNSLATNAYNVGDNVYTRTSKYNVSGPNLVINGNFTEGEIGFDGWIATDPVYYPLTAVFKKVEDGGVCVIDGQTGLTCGMYQRIAIDSGGTYVVTINVKGAVAGYTDIDLYGGNTNYINAYFNTDGTLGTKYGTTLLYGENGVNGGYQFSFGTDDYTEVAFAVNASKEGYIIIDFRGLNEGLTITDVQCHLAEEVFDDRIARERIKYIKEFLINSYYENQEYKKLLESCIMNLEEVLFVETSIDKMAQHLSSLENAWKMFVETNFCNMLDLIPTTNGTSNTGDNSANWMKWTAKWNKLKSDYDGKAPWTWTTDRWSHKTAAANSPLQIQWQRKASGDWNNIATLTATLEPGTYYWGVTGQGGMMTLDKARWVRSWANENAATQLFFNGDTTEVFILNSARCTDYVYKYELTEAKEITLGIVCNTNSNATDGFNVEFFNPILYKSNAPIGAGKDKFRLIYMLDGKIYSNNYIGIGESIIKEEPPIKEGYTFSGWSEIPDTMPAEDVIVYGEFKINEYEICFILEDSIIKKESLLYGEGIIIPEVQIREGYTFNGWGEVPETMPAEDLVYEGSYTINSYNITYSVDDNIYKRDTITYNSPLTPEEFPVKEGHTFSGWSEIPDSMPAHDINVYGSFIVNKYEVAYVIGQDTLSVDSVAYGNTVPLPDAPVKEGYTFNGWEGVKTMPAEDIVLTGSYTINNYKLEYVVDGELYHSTTVTYSDTIVPISTTPSKEGYTFVGWVNLPTVMPANDVRATAMFEANRYRITYIVDNQVVAIDSVAYGTDVVLMNPPTVEGYTFAGWSYVPEKMPAADVMVIGIYTINSYQLTYMVDSVVYDTKTIVYDEDVPVLEEPTKEGYTFSGWSEIPETMPASDVIISGTFTVNKYLVTFKIGDEVIAADSLEYGASIVAPEAPEKEGYTFDGWGEVAEIVPANDVTIEGSYSVNSYLLTYAVDGETVQTDSVAYGTAITLLDEPIKEGHTFSGWSEAPETMPAIDVLISGTFTVNKYLITFKIDDEVIAADSLEYGATIVAPEAPEKEGYTFDGWGEIAETVPAGNATYEGTYTVNIYKVYYYVGEELVHTAEVAYGEAIPEYVYEPTEAGYTFLGWIGDTYETMPAHDVTYTANIDDAIEQLTIHNSQLTIYDLSGRKVLDTENLKGGIYIVNGHKVIVK